MDHVDPCNNHRDMSMQTMSSCASSVFTSALALEWKLCTSASLRHVSAREVRRVVRFLVSSHYSANTTSYETDDEFGV